VALEPGLDLHEWETRWQELQELAADEPEQALPELVRLVEQMLTERGYGVENPVVMEGEDPEVLRDYLAARDVARLCEAGRPDPGDVAAALQNVADVRDYLVQDRRTP
jgi:hypothetical protein